MQRDKTHRSQTIDARDHRVNADYVKDFLGVTLIKPLKNLQVSHEIITTKRDSYNTRKYRLINVQIQIYIKAINFNRLKFSLSLSLKICV